LQQNFTVTLSFEHENPNIDEALKNIRGLIFIKEPEVELITKEKQQNKQIVKELLSCNVPTLGHHHRAETYDDQSSQMDVIASTGVFERHCGVQLAFIIIFHHYEPFCTGWLWFRSIPTISMILTILSYKLIQITEEGILGTLLGGTSQCNSSLELGGEELQDGMARSDFQWSGKP
jgi:hypothetical protein